MSFDFEGFRHQQVLNNAEALEETNIGADLKHVHAHVQANKPASGPASGRKKSSAGTKRKSATEDVGTARETRSSRRNAPRAARVELTEAQREQMAKEQAEKDAAEAEQLRILKHSDRNVEASEGGVKMALDTDSLLAEFKNLASYSGGTGGDDGSGFGGNGSWAVGQRPVIETEKLRKEMDPLELRAIVKIIPERIYSMVVHPDTQRDLIFAGDKVGNVALWDCTDAGKLVGSVQSSSVRDGAAGIVGADGEDEWEDEGEEERVWGKWWHWNAHTGRNSISWLKFRPNQPSSIYHSSYDRTLRVTHFETGMSEEVIDGDRWSDEALLHSFDFDPTGNELWVSDNNGGLIWRDLRQPKESAKRWDIDRYKVGCISINQANPNLAATAHVKRNMCLWDLSTLRGLPETAEPTEVQEKARILAFEHEYACSSAYFDPTGTRLATTSYDDSIRVWNVEPSKPRAITRKKFEPLHRIAHNCQVGRYVTVLRAHWSTVPSLPPHLHVGNMQRTIDLISPDGVTVKMFHNLDAITAVPAVTAAHPTVAGKYYGGAASGKVSFWSDPLEEDFE